MVKATCEGCLLLPRGSAPIIPSPSGLTYLLTQIPASGGRLMTTDTIGGCTPKPSAFCAFPYLFQLRCPKYPARAVC
jgi:hypothetical protein